jgi:hypothetical protein
VVDEGSPGRRNVADRRPCTGGDNSIPPVEYVEMKQAGEFQVINFAGNVVRPASREDVENAPFRSMQDPEPLQEAVGAWETNRYGYVASQADYLIQP